VNRNSGLDLIRVAAALSVFVFHLEYVGGVAFVPLVGPHGFVAVDVFFVLSGYLVYRPFLRGPMPVSLYARRRAGRIAPAMLLAIAFAVAVTPRIAPAGLLVLWSLLLEIAFYACLPLLAVIVAGSPRRLAALIMGSLAVDLVALAAGGYETLPDVTRFPAVAWIFGLGMMTAMVEKRRPELLRRWYLLPLGAIVLASGLISGQNTMLDFEIAGGAALLVAGCVGRPARLPLAPLAAELSYPFYLWHLTLILALLGLGLHGSELMLAAFVLALTESVPLAHAVHEVAATDGSRGAAVANARLSHCQGE
jgi:peptidoglycan/LPS O-acetylase OafA/YrhL